MNEVGEASTQEEQAAPDDRQDDEEEPAWLGVLSDEPLRFAVVSKGGKVERGPAFSARRRACLSPRRRRATGLPASILFALVGGAAGLATRGLHSAWPGRPPSRSPRSR